MNNHLPHQHDIHIEGHKLAAITLNPDAPGEPAVLLHGIIGSPGFWSADLLPGLLEQGPCYALSLPGHYPGAFPPDFTHTEISADMMARILTGAIRSLVNDQPVTLMGYSTGGFAALAIAAQTPGLARRVVSLAGFAHGQWDGTLGQNQRRARSGPAGRAFFKLFYTMGRLNRAMFRLGWRIYPADEAAFFAYPHLEAMIDRSYADFKQVDLDAMLSYFRAMPDIDISDWLPRILAPTLVIAGDSDPTVPPDQARQIAAKLPNAEMALIKGAGHCPFAERPADYQRLLSEWLNKTRLGA